METKHTTVSLSDEAWVAISEIAALEEKSNSELCTYLLEDYIEMDQRVIYSIPKSQKPRTQRSIYFPTWIFPRLRALKAEQHRSISVILEQLIRIYTGLPVDQGD